MFRNQKVIRLKRSNLWDRYKSLLSAQNTGVWHARGNTDNDVSSKKGLELQVPIEKMIGNIAFMRKVDDNADAWAKTYASDVLFVDYQECRASPRSCQSKMLEFLGVDATKIPKNSGSRISAFVRAKDPLHNLKNREEVSEAMGANGWGSFINLSNYTKLQLLVYETEPLSELTVGNYQGRYMNYLRRFEHMKGINVTVIGQGTRFRGFGSKYAAAIPGKWGGD